MNKTKKIFVLCVLTLSCGVVRADISESDIAAKMAELRRLEAECKAMKKSAEGLEYSNKILDAELARKRAELEQGASFFTIIRNIIVLGGTLYVGIVIGNAGSNNSRGRGR
jgi:uncharacterized membrane protein